METITYSEVQALVMRLPETKLPLAYEILASLADNDTEPPSPQSEFLLLPLDEQRRIMMEQAEQMVTHYEQTAVEREVWQAGDFVDES